MHILCVNVYVYVCPSCVFPRVCLSVSVIEGGVCLCDCVSEEMHLCVCLPMSMYSSGTIAWADPQRERLTSPCVKSSHPLDQRYPAELSLVVAVVHATKHHHTALPLVSVERTEGESLRTATTALSEMCLSTHQGPIQGPVYRCINSV